MKQSLQQTEKQFMQAVLDYARFNGWLCYHVFDSRRSAPGFPDLCMVRDGELVFAELKTDDGKVTKAQTEWIEELLRCEEYPDSPVQVFIWRPSDWPQIESVLRRRALASRQQPGAPWWSKSEVRES